MNIPAYMCIKARQINCTVQHMTDHAVIKSTALAFFN
jgi:hypothetical protein